jgi:hypothetical protein
VSGGERERPVVPRAEPRSYYGRPVIKSPVWTWEIPVYFFVGGMAGASAVLGELAELRGEEELARRAWTVALGGAVLSPALLVSDLGRPARFLNMLRVLKVTSPMSVGSWTLAVFGPAAALAAVNAQRGLFPRLSRPARPVAALSGLVLATYTSALVANTAVPVWSEARLTLPFVFSAGAAASAGAAGTILTPERHSGAARRLAIGGAVAEVCAARLMERRLGDLGEPYRRGSAGVFGRAAQGLAAAGAGVLAATRGRSRGATLAGAGMVLGGAMLERWAVYRAGFQSAADPSHTVGPQRERLARAAAPAARTSA